MKYWKTTVVLLTATVGIGAYVSLYELKQPTTEERQRQAKRVLELSADAVTQITLDLPNIKATVTRTGSSWMLASPHGRANSMLINELLSQAAPLMAERVLSGTKEHPLAPKSYGLDPAVGWITIVAHEHPITLLIGDTTPVGGNRYMQVSGHPEIFIVSSVVFDTVNKSLEIFRDRFLLPVNEWLMHDVTITTPSTKLALVRQDNGWRLTHPHADRADRSGVSALASQLAQLQIKRFVNDVPQVEQLSSWGFDHPKGELTVRYGEPTTQTTLFFGKPLPDDNSLLYAKRSDELFLYAVSTADVDHLLKDPNDLRAKSCFDFFTGNVTKVELASAKTAWTIERTEKGDWREKSSGTILNKERVETFLNSLAEVRVEYFVEDAPSELSRYGLTPPKGSVTIWTSDRNEAQRLETGTTVEDSKNTYGYLKERNVVVVLPDALTGLLQTAPEQLRSPELPARARPSPTALTPHPSAKPTSAKHP